jgi:hypothetical protein
MSALADEQAFEEEYNLSQKYPDSGEPSLSFNPWFCRFIIP